MIRWSPRSGGAARRAGPYGFADGQTFSTPARNAAAAKLELDLAHGIERPGLTPERACELLAGLYAGRLDGRLGESGHVHVWALPDAEG